MRCMKIRDVMQLKKNTIINVEVSVSNIVKNISKDGVLFYFLDISDGVNKIEACIFPLYFEQEMKVNEHKPVGTGITNVINDKVDLDEFTEKYSKVKLQCLLSKDNSTMLYYILDIEKLKD